MIPEVVKLEALLMKGYSELVPSGWLVTAARLGGRQERVLRRVPWAAIALVCERLRSDVLVH